jgi:hypothetical protein
MVSHKENFSGCLRLIDIKSAKNISYDFCFVLRVIVLNQ